LISEKLAGGDCLNVGCVPSKALLRAAKALREVKRSSTFGIQLSSSENNSDINSGFTLDFSKVMKRLREKRTQISPADGHEGTAGTGCHVFQGRGRFTSPTTIDVNGTELKFKHAIVATGGRPQIPTNIPGLAESPYVTNEQIFNLDQELPPRMVILGSGVIALEMAQCFATFGSKVTVLNRSGHLFESRGGDEEAAQLLQTALEEDGVTFLSHTEMTNVETVRDGGADADGGFPLMKLTIESGSGDNKKQQSSELECECLLVATGRTANVEDLGLDVAGVEYTEGKGVKVNDLCQSVSNPQVWGVGDVVAGVPRQTHQSGEMARIVVQNALFADDWKLSSLVTPSVMYTEPEYATVGIASAEQAEKQGLGEVDVYRGGLEHNDRAILESDNPRGFCKIVCEKGTDKILGATIIADRAGEMINEVTLAMKHGIPIGGIGRNMHAYPSTGEAVMGAGLQYIGTQLPSL
jgi:pyruvate/2-oxoglutarate dehydrogenase complex dihydrolipoamide dehydrogenase (E3) component